MTTAKNAEAALDLKAGDAVVYPGRGVGRVNAVEEQEAAGFKLEMFVITFERENAVLKIPTARAAKQGLRAVSDQNTIDAALEVMAGRPKKSKQMWSRRAIELDSKLNSGNLLQLAEVARDLHRAEGEAEASYSERAIYDNAVGLIAAEVEASMNVTFTQAMEIIQKSLARSPRGSKGLKGSTVAEDDEEDVKVA